MTRLTNNLDNKYCTSVYKKLKEIEDIEEEIGVDIITLYKACKNGIYTLDGEVEKDKVDYIDGDEPSIALLYAKGYLSMKDYGKTWALTKEELENEQH